MKWCKFVSLFVTAILFAVGFSASAAKKTAAAKGSVVAFDDVKFEAMDAKNPYSPDYSVASGNPWKGPSVFYMKLKKGESGLHMHNSAYHAVLVKGTAKHWSEGEDPASAKILNVGSYWFQPAKQYHGDQCLDDNGCVVALNVAGKFDFVPKEQTKK